MQAPDSETWLALDEQERVALVEAYHEESGSELPNLMMHAAIHAVVENQLAMGIEPVQNALKRLQKEGLDRHDAIHAIGSVLVAFIHELMGGGPGGEARNQEYYDQLDALTAQQWLDS